jgi:hypothetical protein
MMAGSLTASYGAPGYDVLVGASYKEGSPYLAGDGRNFTEFVPDLATTANPRFRDRSRRAGTPSSSAPSRPRCRGTGAVSPTT